MVQPIYRAQLETARSANRYLADVDSDFLPRTDGGPHNISGFEAVKHFGSSAVANWESICVRAAHLPGAVTRTLDSQGFEDWDAKTRPRIPHARRVYAAPALA